MKNQELKKFLRHSELYLKKISPDIAHISVKECALASLACTVHVIAGVVLDIDDEERDE